MEYIVMVLMVAVVIVWVLMVFVLPKFNAIFNEMLGPDEALPDFTLMVLKISETIKNIAAQLFIGTLLLVGVFYENIKRCQEWLPWCRKRLQRDYSRMLALLLDSGVPEEKAVSLAAQGTSSRVFKERARKVIAGLQSGMGLTEAIKLMDGSKEFQWRLTNALQTEGNFVDALSGWHQSLSAQADRQCQTLATLMEAAMVLFLGLIVGSVMIAVFLPLIKLMEIV